MRKDDRLINEGVESLVIGIFAKDFTAFSTYNGKIDCDVHFTSEETRFLFELLSLYYSSHSNNVTRTKMSVFVNLDKKRLAKYEEIGGFELIEGMMELGDANDIEFHLEALNKFAYLRMMASCNFPYKKIIEHEDFDAMTTKDVQDYYQIVIDKTSQKTMTTKKSKILGEDAVDYLHETLAESQMGLRIGSPMMEDAMLGVSKGELLINMYNSGCGKSRWAVFASCYLALYEGMPVGYVSNEMGDIKMLRAYIVTLFNNKIFHKFFPFEITHKLKERDFVLGRYKNDNGIYIERETDEHGNFVFGGDKFEKILIKNSSQYRQVKQLTEWISKNSLFTFSYIDEYDAESIITEFKKLNTEYGAEVFVFDTLKGSELGEWQSISKSATKMQEFAQDNGYYVIANSQAVDSAQEVPIEEWSTMCIAEGKYIYKVADTFVGGKRIQPHEYDNYMVTKSNGESKKLPVHLLKDKAFFMGRKIMKNRNGAVGDCLVYIVDLDRNTYFELGYLERIV